MHVHGHGQGHHHGHGRANDRRALAIALGLIVALMAGEVAAGIAAGSLALLADAGHMLTDAAALAAAFVASRLASRPARGPWTFGLGRTEILAAQANGLSLLILGIWIVYSAVRRLVSPPHVHGGIVLVVALVGVAVNLAATFVLSRADRSSLNVRGAYLHIATDLAAFAGTALAGHVLVAPGADCHDARRRLQALLEQRFALHHTTLQVDHVARRSQNVRLGALERS